MRRALALLVLVLAALAAAAPATARPDLTVVVGHGTLGSGPIVVSVSAFDFGGTVGGLLRSDNGGGFVFVSRVTCVRRVADRVLVGGVIISSPSPTTLGHTSMIDLEENGPAPDRLGIAFSSSGLDSCPDIGPPLHQVTGGNFFVFSA